MHIPSFIQGVLVAATLGGVVGRMPHNSPAPPQFQPTQSKGTKLMYFVEHPDHVQAGTGAGLGLLCFAGQPV